VIRTRPAGFWIRVVAAVLDFALFALVNLSLKALAVRVWRAPLEGAGSVEGTVGTCTFLFVAAYVIVLHALEGQTVGKLIVGVRVVGADGTPPTLGASVLRFIAYGASLVPFGLGFVMAGLRADRRALHDLLAGTRVERLAPPPPPAPPAPPAAPEPEELLAPPPA
jgi:uncharacterized RDD family membrane protein YckC